VARGAISQQNGFYQDLFGPNQISAKPVIRPERQVLLNLGGSCPRRRGIAPAQFRPAIVHRRLANRNASSHVVGNQPFFDIHLL
jgi:hypothetical protein